MNGLYGYPMSGPMALGYLGAVPKKDLEATFYKVVSGESYGEISAALSENKKDFSDLDGLLGQIKKMPEGLVKDKAMRLYEEANASATKEFSILQQVRSDYNEAVRKISSLLAPIGIQPKTLSGMDALPVIPIAVVSGAIVAAGYLFSQINQGLAAWRGQNIETKGYIAQIADAIQATGGAIRETGTAVLKIAGAGLIVFAVVQLFRRRIGRSA